jgi:hypothetical protein
MWRVLIVNVRENLLYNVIDFQAYSGKTKSVCIRGDADTLEWT